MKKCLMMGMMMGMIKCLMKGVMEGLTSPGVIYIVRPLPQILFIYLLRFLT